MKFWKIKEIGYIEKENGYWVKVTFENGTEWLPGLIDLGEILNRIGKCEDQKYPYGEGRNYTKKFIAEAMEAKNLEDIKNIYNKKFNPNKK